MHSYSKMTFLGENMLFLYAGGEENVELTVTIQKEEYEKVSFELVQEADGE